MTIVPRIDRNRLLRFFLATSAYTCGDPEETYMPQLTIVNLQASPVSFQDTSGLTSTSFTALGSTTTIKAVPDLAMPSLEPQLNAEQTAGKITWTIKDDPSTPIDNPPSSPAILDEATYFVIRDDFPLAGSGTLPAPLAKAVQGSATGDYVANAPGGVYSLATAAVSEAEAAQLTHGDQLLLDPTKGPVFEARAVSYTHLTLP